ncbi:uncharacterized protein LOC120665787 [Panicum virgatum]|uniref:uncharacterized protein LOC120665787 n=1 Tax=Panicum virgatum TaxID=38727 RepID=UPI0019D531ED|nr:uncharacterized protein LOC120665787 [Panicum virgatum]
MARLRPGAPLRNGAGGEGQPSGPSALGVAMPGVDEHPGDDHLADELEMEDDDVREDAAALFGIDVGDGNVPNNVIDVDAEAGAGDGGGGAAMAAGCGSTDTHVTSSSGKRKSSVWADFKEVRKMMCELLLSVTFVARDCLLDLVLVLVICVTAYDDDFDILLWWRDHKLTYPILSIMARDIMSVPVSTIFSESCFSLTGRILEERRRRLLPENVEMLTCIKDWELGARREQHEAEDTELEEAFKNLFLDDEGAGGGGAVS